ncbi:MAG: hypothetical protein NZ992_00205 [Candidatus Korarchaeum sp.]|nr:hypothetical protein [Candidatus Korarchaeum sp.]
MTHEELIAWILAALVIIIVISQNVGGIRDKLCNIDLIKNNNFLSNLLGCGGGVIIPDTPPDGRTTTGGGGGGDGGDGGGGGTTTGAGGTGRTTTTERYWTYTSTQTYSVPLASQPPGRQPGGVYVGGYGGDNYPTSVGVLERIPSGGPSYSSFSSSATILSKMTSVAPPKGAYSPFIKGVTVWADIGRLAQSGWYQFEISAFYESCGSSSKSFIAPEQNLYLACTQSGACFVYWTPANSRPLTKREAEAIMSKYCPNPNWIKNSVPPEYAWACMFYWDIQKNPEAREIWRKAHPDSYLAPMQATNRGLGRLSTIAVIVPIDLLNAYLDPPCNNATTQLVKVYYRILYCGGEDKKAPPGSCQPVTPWTEGTSVRVYTRPSGASPSDVTALRYLKGVEVLEINGRIYSVINLQAIGLPRNTVVDVYSLLANLAMSLLLAYVIVSIYSRSRVRGGRRRR